MGDTRVITPAQHAYLHKVDSGGVKFKLEVPLPGLGPAVTLIAKHDKTLELYKIIIGQRTKILNMNQQNQEVQTFKFTQFEVQVWQHLWVSWNNKKLKMGVISDLKPIVNSSLHTDFDIGYVQFNTMAENWSPVNWIVETSPVIFKPIAYQVFKDRMYWRPMQNGILPPGAMIGGFEDEPIYIARAHHNNSLCPGKYVPSQNKAYVPWGHREHVKTEFEILCGYNAVWEKTLGDRIPLNAFIGGRSEVQNEPLYIGRTEHEGKLITGKVHVCYKTCYLPYKGKEIEKWAYEILVIPQKAVPQAIPGESFTRDIPGRHRANEAVSPFGVQS